MGMMRRMLGWLLVICGVFVLVSSTLAALIGMTHSSSTPMAAYGLAALLFGVCPTFLGWVLIRRKASAPVTIAAVVPKQLLPAEPAAAAMPADLVVDTLIQGSDLVHLQYWIFAKNWFVRLFYAGFLVAVFVIILHWQTLHWESFQRNGWQNLLYPVAVLGLLALPWLNARLAMLKYALTVPSQFTFSSTGFRAHHTGSTIDSSWDSVGSCWETTRAFVFLVRPPSRILYRPEPVDATIIPKRCFQHPGDEARLRALLAQALGRRAVLLSPG